MPTNQRVKPDDERILAQTHAEILAVNDHCLTDLNIPDLSEKQSSALLEYVLDYNKKHKLAMRGIILSALDRMFYRLREYYANNDSDRGIRGFTKPQS